MTRAVKGLPDLRRVRVLHRQAQERLRIGRGAAGSGVALSWSSTESCAHVERGRGGQGRVIRAQRLGPLEPRPRRSSAGRGRPSPATASPVRTSVRRVAEAAQVVHRHLEPLGRRGTPRSADRTRSRATCSSAIVSNPAVTSGLAYAGAADLVEQLGRHRADGDHSSRAGMLRDDRAAVGGDLGDREAGVLEPGHVAEEGVVAARGLGPALDDVAGDQRPGQRVERRLVARARGRVVPPVPPGRRADDQRRVRDAAR